MGAIRGRSQVALLVLGMAIFAAFVPTSAPAQQQTDKPFDFKPLLPPVVPIPPNSAVTSGAVGGRQDPYTTAPLQSPPQAPTQTAPGMRFSIPTR
jgi:hypothetical protein